MNNDIIKIPDWFDEIIKTEKLSRIVMELGICKEKSYDDYSAMRRNNPLFTKKQYNMIQRNFSKYLESLVQDYEVEEEKTPLGWIPEFGEAYYFVNAVGNVKGYTYLEDDEDELRFKYMRAFKTEEEAEFEKERIKVTRELEKYAREFKKGGYNYYISVDRAEMAINFTCMQTVQFQGLCFESVKKAKEAIKAVGEDRIIKYYFGVENE